MSDYNRPSFFSSLRFRYGLGLAFFLIVGGYFLWAEHEAHIREYLPIMLVLGLCLGMHFFMHGSHGSHDKSNNDKDADK